MRKIEIGLLIVLLVAIILRVIHIPGGGLVTVFSLSTLSMAYFLLGFAFFNDIRIRKVFDRNSYKGVSFLELITGILLGKAIAFVIMGILFKNLLWPGHSLILFAGGSLFVLTLILLTLRKFKVNSFTKRVRYIVIYGVLGLIAYLIPVNAIIDFYNRDNPEYAKALQEFNEDPSDEAARQKLKELDRKMRDEARGSGKGFIDEDSITVFQNLEENPYPFDTLLSNGYHLKHRVFKKPGDSWYVQSLTLMKSDKIIKEFGYSSFGLPYKNIGYIGADFDKSFVMVYSYGSGNPHIIQLIDKETGEELKQGEWVDAFEPEQVLLFIENGQLKFFDVKYNRETLVSGFDSLTCVQDGIGLLSGCLKIDTVTTDSIKLTAEFEVEPLSKVFTR